MPEQLPFAGLHTQTKLSVVEGYLKAYVTALKKHRFHTVFFDAFAGTGELPLKGDEAGMFADVEEVTSITGSARRALAISPPFSQYIFVEKMKGKISALEKLRSEFPHRAPNIVIKQADANDAIAEFCARTDWRRTRAVMFLDPFGNQVKWSAIEAIAKTKAIDLWYLFPAQLGVGRQISRSGEFDETKAASLDRLLGTTAWREEFIRRYSETDLWGNSSDQTLKQVTVDGITRFMIRRMKIVFKGGVLDEWLPLGRGGAHWYSLLFAWANPSKQAGDIAQRISQSLMKRK
jgi:three-Cys-motif partner protein